jgi:Protein of unknown function (DUF3180)
MRPTRVRSLLLLAAVATLLSLLLQRALRSSGWTMPPVPWTAAVGLALVACLVYSAAVPVRRMLRGVPGARPVHPLRAARAAVLGKATAYAGAVVLGWYLAAVLLLLPDLDVDARQAQAVRAGVTALAALAACIAGLLAERMCRVPPDEGDRSAAGPGLGRGAGRSADDGQDRDLGGAGVTREALRHG